MFPPVHPGVAYLVYRPIAQRVRGEPPGGAATVALVIASILPDLIDQPLFQIADVPSTRTLGHSLLLGVPLCVLVIGIVWRTDLDPDVALAFTVGYGSHLAADALWPFLFGAFDELGFLLWPLTHSPPYPGRRVLGELAGVTVTTLWIELVLLGIAILLWWIDGRPGLPTRTTRGS